MKKQIRRTTRPITIDCEELSRWMGLASASKPRRLAIHAKAVRINKRWCQRQHPSCNRVHQLPHFYTIPPQAISSCHLEYKAAASSQHPRQSRANCFSCRRPLGRRPLPPAVAPHPLPLSDLSPRRGSPATSACPQTQHRDGSTWPCRG